MTEALTELASRIRQELDELQRVVKRIVAGWQQAKRTADDFHIDAVALNLHGFYSGLERLFELTATQVDNSLPQGTNWHKELLAQMASEIPSVRPAVISEETRTELEPFRGFRHVVRNVYTHALVPERIDTLVAKCEPLFERLRSELLAFAQFLERTDAGDVAGT